MHFNTNSGMYSAFLQLCGNLKRFYLTALVVVDLRFYYM